MSVGQYYLLPEYVIAKLGRPPLVFMVFTTFYNLRVRSTHELAENTESTKLLLQVEAEAKLANRSCAQEPTAFLYARLALLCASFGDFMTAFWSLVNSNHDLPLEASLQWWEASLPIHAASV